MAGEPRCSWLLAAQTPLSCSAPSRPWHCPRSMQLLAQLLRSTPWMGLWALFFWLALGVQQPRTPITVALQQAFAVTK